MPEKPAEEKKAGQSAGAVGSIIFALLFNILLFVVAPLLLTNIVFIWRSAGPTRRRSRRMRLAADDQGIYMGSQAALVDRL